MKLTDISIVPAVSQCSLLHDLILSGCGKITDKTLIAASQHCTNLVKLALNGCKKVTNTGLIEIGKKCSNLSELFLARCGNLSVALEKIGNFCTRMSTLDLYLNRATATNSAIRCIASNSKEHLQGLYMSQV
jgi:hypothetical protein